MLESMRLARKISECRQKINDLLSLETRTDEQTQELGTLTKAIQTHEVEYRAALTAEGVEETTNGGETPEMRERRELRGRANVTAYVLSALRGALPSGAEQEYLQACGVAEGIPLDIFVNDRIEIRADAPTLAPGTVGLNLDPLLPSIFARAVLPRLGVSMPQVPSGSYATGRISTDLTAGAKAAGADAEATAAAITVESTTPKRVSARLAIRIEDIEAIGVGNFEQILRQNLMLAMSDELDNLGLTGNGTDPNPHGLIPQLADPTDPSQVVTFNDFVGVGADGIDGGPWAETMRDVRLVFGRETMQKAEKTFQTATNFQGETSAASYLRQNAGGLFASSRMPAPASHVQKILRHRAGTNGLEGVNAIQTAICPVWNKITIDDIYSGSASATRYVTLHALIGDVIVQQPSAYELAEVKLA